MCGIAGIFAYHYAALEVSRQELRRIRDSMGSRGPDGAGEWYSEDGRVGLGHRRLAIIDLSEKAAQPMPSEDGSVVVSFNGEIYNYRELRSQLEQKGHHFRSESDTEVMIHLYQEKGEAMVETLRGMFALILWDAKQRKMLLARDPYGIKPLYYADDGWTVRVASQVKALLASEKVSRLAEPAGIVGFFLMGSVPEPFTLYQEIRQVPAGSLIWVGPTGAALPKSYFSISKIFREARDSMNGHPGGGIQEKVREALRDTVRHHLVSDVPVGAFLSGGIDSGSLVGLARDVGPKDLRTVTLAFDEFLGENRDEAPFAEEVARVYRTRHETQAPKASEFRNDLSRFFEAMDQPTIDGVNTYFLSKAGARAGLKVALSGLGGDELFGGYPSFYEIPCWVRALALPSKIPFLGDAFRYLLNICRGAVWAPKKGGVTLHPKFAGLLKYGGSYPGAYFLKRGLFMPWELETMLEREVIHEGFSRLRLLDRIEKAIEPDPQTPFGRIAALEASLYMRNQLLRDADWAGMAHSLEIRVPFVDAWLLKSLAPLLVFQPAANYKSLLAGSLQVPLPEKILRRAKTGFSVPIEKWLETDSELDGWRRIPALAGRGCPWARRWAYVVMEHQKAVGEPVLSRG